MAEWQTDKTVTVDRQWTGNDMWLLAGVALVGRKSADFRVLVGWMWSPGDFVQAWHSSRRQL